jgi:hypothetical protein
MPYLLIRGIKLYIKSARSYTMTIKQEIINYLSDRDHGTIGYDQTILDANHFARRMFRCWLDGSYLGESQYHAHCDSARDNYNDDKALRRVVIHSFVSFLAFEFNCSFSTAQSAAVEALQCVEMQSLLNNELIDDLRDLVRDEVEAA